jgi:hypothetical protein
MPSSSPDPSLELLSDAARRRADRVTARLVRLATPLAPLVRRFATLHDHARFEEFLRSVDTERRSGDYRHFVTRAEHWNYLAELLRDRFSTEVIYEFGVANGNGARFWLDALPHTAYHGFDTFTGMPESYRQLPVGILDVGGSPPFPSSDRVSWHVGLVEDTLDGVEFASRSNRLFVLDLDLYGPTRVVLDRLQKHLHSGDVLYFDEAFDNDEGVAFRHFFRTRDDLQLLCSSTGTATVVVR